MASDYLDIGATPALEPCEQVGKNYDGEKALKECRVFVNQLLRQFGEPPYGARIAPKRMDGHDFGSYWEVVVYYNEDIEEAIEFAFKVEKESPNHWDEEAKKELGL